jgi:CheY-like chemotaxis protein
VGRPTIAIVDDRPEFADLLSDVLSEDGGYVVHTFTEAPGVDELAAARPDALVLDLLLGTDEDAGWSLLRRLRGGASTLSHVPVVICSGDVLALRDRGRELAAMPAVFILEKPFGLDELQAVMQRALGADRLVSSNAPAGHGSG